MGTWVLQGGDVMRLRLESLGNVFDSTRKVEVEEEEEEVEVVTVCRRTLVVAWQGGC